MKSALLATLLALAGGFALPTHAASDHMGHGSHAHAPAAADAQLAEGVVKKVDKATGKVTLTHGPLANGMPGMTMAFSVKDAAWLDKMKAGDKIRFQAEQVNGSMTVVRFEPAK